MQSRLFSTISCLFGHSSRCFSFVTLPWTFFQHFWRRLDQKFWFILRIKSFDFSKAFFRYHNFSVIIIYVCSPCSHIQWEIKQMLTHYMLLNIYCSQNTEYFRNGCASHCVCNVWSDKMGDQLYLQRLKTLLDFDFKVLCPWKTGEEHTKFSTL